MSMSAAMCQPIRPVDAPTLHHAPGTVADTIGRIMGTIPMAHTGGLAIWQIRRVIAFIEAHLDTPIKVKNLSAIVQLSASYFSQAFKKSFGAAPHAYVIQRRLDRARHLMLTSDARLSEIALTCGFTDQAHLCRQFRQATGHSPAAWRQRAIARSA